MSFQATIGPTLTHVGASRARPLEIRDLGPGALDVSATRGGDGERLGPGETTVLTDGAWLSSPSRAEIAITDAPPSHVDAPAPTARPRPARKPAAGKRKPAAGGAKRVRRR